MRKLIIAVFVVMFCAGMVYADPDKDAEPAAEQSICPKTKMDTSCLLCHKVEKTDDGYGWVYNDYQDLPGGADVRDIDGIKTIYYQVNDIDSDRFQDIYEVARKNGIKHVWFEMFSPGGSVAEAWRAIAFMQMYRNAYGIKSTTECLGYAASAAFVLTASGDRRIVAPNAMMMAHELWTVDFLKIETPSSAKDQTDTLQLWQDNLNAWLADHSDMTQEEISAKIHKLDWWMTGNEFYEHGFADELAWGGFVKWNVDSNSAETH